MFEIGIVEQFEAIHSLRGNFGPATQLHGHTYKVEVLVQGENVDDSGVLCDISKLKDGLQSILGRFHYQNLNKLEEFKGRNSTAENLSKLVFQRMEIFLFGESIERLKVTVWESPQAFASYSGCLTDQ